MKVVARKGNVSVWLERMRKILLFDSQVHEAGYLFHIAHLVFQMLFCSWLKSF